MFDLEAVVKIVGWSFVAGMVCKLAMIAALWLYAEMMAGL